MSDLNQSNNASRRLTQSVVENLILDEAKKIILKENQFDIDDVLTKAFRSVPDIENKVAEAGHMEILPDNMFHFAEAHYKQDIFMQMMDKARIDTGNKLRSLPKETLLEVIDNLINNNTIN